MTVSSEIERRPWEPGAPQSIVRIVPHGGAKTAKQVRDQWKYLTRKGQLPLWRSERYFGIALRLDQFNSMARSWLEQTGYCPDGQTKADSTQELTTHIVISFPPGTDTESAFAAGRQWAEEMFGSGQNGGSFDYLAACHSDRPHPHVHVIVNRRAMEGNWLKISKREAHFNYDRLRSTIVDVASRYGIDLEATSRAQRGINEPPITYGEYRRQMRRALKKDSDKDENRPEET